MKYYSDREKGPTERKIDTVSATVWGGIAAHITSLVRTGAFGRHYPEMCPDGAGPIGTNEQLLAAAIQAEIPAITWPLETQRLSDDGFTYEPFAITTEAVLDLIEFCYRKVSRPIQRSFHSYFQHYHLSFDDDAGQVQFREVINTIFERNGLAFELNEIGEARRLLGTLLEQSIASAIFNTGDSSLDGILTEACEKIASPRASIRKESLERLWDAWERLKSLRGQDKKVSIKSILDSAASEASFRSLLEKEAIELTSIGNTFQIRHSEVGKPTIDDPVHVDYLFHRLFSMISMILKKI